MGSVGITELIIVLVIVLLVFGPSRLGAIGSSLGKGIRSFRRSIDGEETPPNGEDESNKTDNSEFRSPKG